MLFNSRSYERGPKVVAVADFDQLRSHPQRVALAPDAPFEQRADLQLLADLLHAERLALEREDGSARSDVQALDVGECVDQLLGDAVGEVVGLLVAAHVDEGQDRDRGGRRGDQRGLARGEEVDDSGRSRCEAHRQQHRGEAQSAMPHAISARKTRRRFSSAKSGSSTKHSPRLNMAPTLVTTCTALPPGGAAPPAVWRSQSRVSCLDCLDSRSTYSVRVFQKNSTP